jgi:hypothetical protein
MTLEELITTLIPTGATILSGWLLNRQRDLHVKLKESDELRAKHDTRIAVLEALANTKDTEMARLYERLDRIDEKLDVLPRLEAILGVISKEQ